MGIKATIVRKAAAAKYKIAAKSPEIMLVGGTVMVVAAGVLACKQTIKACKIVEETEDTIGKIEEAHNSENPMYENKAGEIVPYTDKEYETDRKLVYFQAGVKLAKTYAIPIALVGAGVFLIFRGFGKVRHLLLLSSQAYAVLAEDFNKFYRNVAEEYGEEKAYELKNGIKTKELESTDPETGEKRTLKAKVIDPNGISKWARMFDRGCKGWEPVPGYNLSYLISLQRAFNRKLDARGYVFLNEVYDALGFEPIPEGQLVGWVKATYPDGSQVGEGDGFISFGIYKPEDPAAVRFVNGWENDAILLDFNVDGRIEHLLPFCHK